MTNIDPQAKRMTGEWLLNAYYGLVQHARMVRDPYGSDLSAEDREDQGRAISELGEQICYLANAVTYDGLLERLAAEREEKQRKRAADSVETFPIATCIRCNEPFGESDDYHQVAMSGPNSKLFIHSEDCEATL